MKNVALYALLFLVLSGIILPKYIKSLRYDLINGGGYGPSFSESREESIERRVYAGDVEFVSLVKNGKRMDLKVKQAWIEKTWRRGAWYWTTIPEDIPGVGVVIITDLPTEELKTLYICNDRISALGNLEGLGCGSGICLGSVRHLPPSDTLRYNVLKKANLDFSEENVIGELILTIKRKQ